MWLLLLATNVAGFAAVKLGADGDHHPLRHLHLRGRR